MKARRWILAGCVLLMIAGPDPHPSDLFGSRLAGDLEDLRALVAWSPDMLPARTARVLERMDDVHDATMVEAGANWLRSSRTASGPVDDPPDGFSIPFEVAFIHPHGYARFVAPRFRPLIKSLGKRQIVIPETEARLRDAGAGLRMRLHGRSVRVAGVVSNHATQGYEALMRGPRPSFWDGPNRFVLVHLNPDGRRRAVRRKILDISQPGLRLAMRRAGEKPFLRYSADVHPQLLFKRAFGEFSARPSGSSLTLPQRWIDRHIATESVPLLGSVRCHREVIPMLRGAMRELRRRGLGSTIHDYGGCFNARTISDDPAYRLSHHSWGAAVDINVGDNCFGCSPRQDPRFVRIMREHGFTWGGRWVRPDGMHFEWWR